MDVSGALTGAGVRAICPSPHRPISLAIWAPLGELVSLEIWGPLSDIALPPPPNHACTSEAIEYQSRRCTHVVVGC